MIRTAQALLGAATLLTFGATAGAVAMTAGTAPLAPASTRAATHAHHHAVVPTLRVTVAEWTMARNRPSLPPGRVNVVVRNTGRRDHVVGVIRTATRAARLPLTAGRPSTKGLVRRIVVHPGRSVTVRLVARRGHYVVSCLLRGHFGHGMRRDLSVRPLPGRAAAPAAPGASPTAGPATVRVATTLQLTTAGIMKYDRAALTAPEGTVTVVLTNREVLPHNVALRGPGLDVKGADADKGRTSTVATELAPGTYAFYCAVPGHEGAGMKGTLTITRGAAAPAPTAPPADPVGGAPLPAPGAGGSAPPASGHHSLTVDGLFTFSATTLQAPAGPVTIDLLNNTALTHNIAIRGAGVAASGPDVGTGATSTVAATLAAGTYTYYCTVPGHEAAGMTGTLVVGGAAAPPPPPAPGTPPPGTPPPPAPGPGTPPPASGSHVIHVTGLFSFSATQLVAPPGPVTITLVNETPLTHNIALKGNGIDVRGADVGSGGQSAITVTLAAGTYTFYCTVAGHEVAGMSGTLTVTADPAATPPPPPPVPVTGKDLFRANCGGCHTLAAAQTTGTVGPNLDGKKPSYAKAMDMMAKGKSPMPSFTPILTHAQMDLIATFVAQSVGR